MKKDCKVLLRSYEGCPKPFPEINVHGCEMASQMLYVDNF